MKSELFKLALDVIDLQDKPRRPNSAGTIKSVKNKVLSYTERHRGQWFKPEYDLEEIQIAQDTDSYLFRALQKKTNRFLVAGWEVVGKNELTLEYIKTRLGEIEVASGIPFDVLVTQTAHDLMRYSNCMWIKVRNDEASSGSVRTDTAGRELDPVAGYFILPMETLQFKTKSNGEIKKVLQETPSGEKKEFRPVDIIHFYTNRKPGFAIGTPEILPVLDDIALLRRLEENIEELIESSLYPLFHYKVGSDTMPERYGPDGVKETDVVKQTIEYMPAGGIYVSDHRHQIAAIGSEGRALRVEGYLDYFKKRVFAGLGVSSVDMGEGDTANRSTAQTISTGAIQDVEALQHVLKTFVEFYVFDELLKEGPISGDIVLSEDRVEMKFGVVDKETRTKLENQVIQLWSNKLVTEDEARKTLGLEPLDEMARENTYFKLYEEPLAMLKFLGFAAADDALAESSTSSITPEGVSKQRQAEEESLSRRTGRPPNPASEGSRRASEAAARPSNQAGTRSGPKFTTDLKDSYREGLLIYLDVDEVNRYMIFFNTFEEEYIGAVKVTRTTINNRIEEFEAEGLSSSSIKSSMDWRLKELDIFYKKQLYNYGVTIGAKVKGYEDSCQKHLRDVSEGACILDSGMSINNLVKNEDLTSKEMLQFLDSPSE